jgi:trimethylamine--corrinoid protein Co-methyltransferase
MMDDKPTFSDVTFPRRGGYIRLTGQQCRNLHGASLEILDGIGVRLDEPRAISLLQKGGARITENGLVCISPKLIEWALGIVPRRLVLYDRFGNPAIPLENERCFYGPGSDCLNIIDHRTQERRRPVLQDVLEGTRLCDALPNIDFVMSMVLPVDVDQTIADTYQMEIMLNHTSKPLIVVSYETRGLLDAVEMAEAVVGGEKALQEKPILTCYINVISGAVHNADGLRKLLYLAEKNLPSLYIPGSSAGITSPSTMAGAVALDNAGALVGLLLTQLTREGAPVIWSAMDGASLDMRTMVSPYAYPERGIIRSMARFYGIPAFALAGASDAKIVDQQAAAEASLSLLADTLMGGNLIHDLGYLESGLTFSFAQLAICNEIVDWIKAFTQDVEVSKETLALDVVREVKEGGQYLSHEHTRRHFREIWYPRLFERGGYSDWQSRGGHDLAERATRQVQQILDTHQPEPLPLATQKHLKEIVQRIAVA